MKVKPVDACLLCSHFLFSLSLSCLYIVGGYLCILLHYTLVSLLELSNLMVGQVKQMLEWEGCFDSSEVTERLAAVLPLCFGEVEGYV